jgi:hypothetical protein
VFLEVPPKKNELIIIVHKYNLVKWTFLKTWDQIKTFIPYSLSLVWPVLLAQVWNPLQASETQHVNIVFCNLCIHFSNSQIWKEIHAWIEWYKAFKCYHILNWFFPSFLPKPGFFGIYLNFQWQKSLLKINISHIPNPNLTK